MHNAIQGNHLKFKQNTSKLRQVDVLSDSLAEN